jgi:hypothetical protein
MDAYLTELEGDAGTEAAKFSAHRDFYDAYLVELRSLRIRVEVQPRNDLTKQQIELMMNSVGELRAAHEAGDLSPEAIAVTRNLFNQAWGAILRLELAKRRGES